MPSQRPHAHTLKFKVSRQRYLGIFQRRLDWGVAGRVNDLKLTCGLEGRQGPNKFICVVPNAGFGNGERKAIESDSHFYCFVALEQPRD